jgi:hypothetical protein
MRSLTLFALTAFATLASAQQPYQNRNAASQPQPATQAEAAAAEQAPQAPQQPNHIVLRVVGSTVRNPSGDRLGRIEGVLVNRSGAVIDYALLATAFPTNSSRVVPIPWSMLNYAWDQSRAGGPAGANQFFIAALTPSQLAYAPTIDPNRPGDMVAALEAASAYFGVRPQFAGGTGSGSEAVSGGAAGQPAGSTIAPQGATDYGTVADPGYGYGYGYPGYYPAFFFGTNGFTNGIPGTPIPTNGVGGVPTPTNGTGRPPFNTNLVGVPPFQPGANPPFTPLNRGTNIAPQTPAGLRVTPGIGDVPFNAAQGQNQPVTVAPPSGQQPVQPPPVVAPPPAPPPAPPTRGQAPPRALRGPGR